MTKKSLGKIFIVFIFGIFFLFLFNAIFINSVSAVERECKAGPFCLEVQDVSFYQDGDNLIFSVSVVCREWRGKANNLHVNIEVFDPTGFHIVQSRRLNALGKGDKQTKFFVLKRAKKGTYNISIKVFDILNSAGMHRVEKIFVKK